MTAPLRPLDIMHGLASDDVQTARDAAQAMLELPAAELSPREWAQVVSAAYRMKSPVPEVRLGTLQHPEIDLAFIIRRKASQASATVAMRYRALWLLMAPKHRQDTLRKPDDPTPQRSLGKITAAAVARPDLWVSIPAPAPLDA